MKYFLEDDIRAYPFKDISHFSNHLNYLFRSDKGQKWTNRDTVKNKYLLYGGDEFIEYPFPYDKQERRKIKNMFYNKHWRQYDKLYFACVECTYSQIKFWTRDMIEEMHEKIWALVDEGWLVLLAVTHDDQPKMYCHYHLILKKKKNFSRHP